MKTLSLTVFAALAFLPAPAPAQWSQANGPYGGDVKGFAEDAAGTLYAAVDPGGVFFSKDKGSTWQRKGFSLIDTTVYCVAASGTTLFAGSYNGILTSTDGGGSWKKRESPPLDFFWIKRISVSGSALFVSDGSSFYRSRDLGGAWTKIDSGLGTNKVQAIATMGGLVFVGGSKDGIFRSADEGATWTLGNSGLPTGDKGIYALVAKGTKLIASVYPGGVFLSADSAKTWSPMNSHLFKGVSDLAVKGDTLLLAADSGSIFMTRDEGESWIRLYQPTAYASINTLIAGNGYILAGRRGDGVLRSGDGGATWSVSNQGMTALRINDLVKFRGGLYAATYGDWISKSTDLGGTWAGLNPGSALSASNKFVNVLGKSGGNLLATSGSSVLLTSDEGLNWKSSSYASLTEFTGFVNLGRFAFAGTKDGIWRSSDNGAIWTRVKENKYGVGDAAISAIAADDSAVYAKSYTTFLISRDSGATWTNLDFVLPKVSGMRPLAVAGNALFTASDPGIFRTSDRVATWSPVNAGLQGSDPSSRLPSISILAEYGGHLLARANDGAIFLTSNRGDTWERVDPGLPVRYVTALVADGEYLYAGTSSGVWRRKFALTPLPVGLARGSDPLSPQDRLEVSVPDAGGLRIAYQVFRPGWVSIRILNLSGTEAARPFDGQAAAGSHSLAWDTQALEPGCYQIMMRAGSRTLAKRVTLFR